VLRFPLPKLSYISFHLSLLLQREAEPFSLTCHTLSLSLEEAEDGARHEEGHQRDGVARQVDEVGIVVLHQGRQPVVRGVKAFLQRVALLFEQGLALAVVGVGVPPAVVQAGARGVVCKGKFTTLMPSRECVKQICMCACMYSTLLTPTHAFPAICFHCFPRMRVCECGSLFRESA